MPNSADFDAILNVAGKTISYSTESTSTNIYGDIAEAATSRGNITAVFQILSEGDNIVQAGLMHVGDAQVFFKNSTLTGSNPPALHDIITADNVNYRIVKLMKEQVGNNAIFYEALCSRINPEA